MWSARHWTEQHRSSWSKHQMNTKSMEESRWGGVGWGGVVGRKERGETGVGTVQIVFTSEQVDLVLRVSIIFYADLHDLKLNQGTCLLRSRLSLRYIPGLVFLSSKELEKYGEQRS